MLSLPFSSQRSKPAYGSSQPTGAFGATCGCRWTDLELGHNIGWKPIVVGVPDSEKRVSRVAIHGVTRSLRAPWRDGGAQYQLGWQIATFSLNLHTLAQLQWQNIFNSLKDARVNAARNTQELTLGEYPDPNLEVSLIQQRERFKRSLARIDVLDISEISWLGAVARMQAKTSTAMVRREQHKRFHDWVLSASNPRAPRGNGIGKLHRHVNSQNVARSLCQVSTEKGVLRSTPSALMEVREAAWAKRWHRETADSEALVGELVSLRASAVIEDVPLLEPVTVDKLDQTLRRIPDNTGQGSDCVEPGAIKHAPVGAKHELCHVLDCISRNGVLPWGLLYVIIALLPKDGAALGGERPIGLLPILVRILDPLFYDELTAWCARTTSDSALISSHLCLV